MKRYGCLLLILTFCFQGCGDPDPLEVDVSSITVPQARIERFDKAFFSLDTNNIPAALDKLRLQYGSFTDGYVNHIVCYNAPDSLQCDLAIRDFLIVYSTRGVWEEALRILGDDFTNEEDQITGAYRHFKFYFPEKELPKGVYFDITNFDYGIIQVERRYGIALEFYLGKTNTFYDALPEKWPAYRRRVSSREYMVRDFVHAWMLNEFPYDPPKNDLINRMIYEGKQLYLQKALLRNTPDSIITGYTGAQLAWCYENEAKMWASLIEKQKVYSEDQEDIQHFTEDAPFTPDFPRESPGKAGNWLGLRIVESYMAKNPGITLEELMKINDGAAILNRSKYKPKF
jgi:hypothetical protein